MKLTKTFMRSLQRSMIRTQANRYMFSNKEQNQEQQNKPNPILQFLKDGWRQTFPKDQDQIRRKYEKVKKVKRYSAEQLEEIQGKIPEYQRTALVQTQQEAEQEKKKFKVSNMIPESVKNKVKETSSYKQFSDFKENFKQYMHTSDSVAVNLGNKAYNLASKPSSTARASETMKQYDKDFSIIQLEKEATYIFKDAYEDYLAGSTQKLQLLCGDSALQLLKGLLKINAAKNTKPKYTQIIDISPAVWQKTSMSEGSLPLFLFHVDIIEIYCMINNNGEIIDGDDQRIMRSTYQFLLKYSGQYIGELGHPWQIVELRQRDQIKLLI